ncbi:hypothetical protein FHT21_002568 [Pedobacter sp. SG908]|nr:hypothetical protein [Pedobacter sp. SG908]
MSIQYIHIYILVKEKRLRKRLICLLITVETAIYALNFEPLLRLS